MDYNLGFVLIIAMLRRNREGGRNTLDFCPFCRREAGLTSSFRREFLSFDKSHGIARRGHIEKPTVGGGP
jgi:hypothetical protein